MTKSSAQDPDGGLPPIHLHDTLTGERRLLETLEPGKVGIYCCGPTVYDMSHVGHARAALAPDVIVRFLRQQGYRVTYVRNITDIDDKIIARSALEGRPAEEVARHYADEYRRDMAALLMLEPDVEPRVSDHIPIIAALVRKLVDRGLAYAVDGDVYFRVERFPAYGRLSKRSLDEMREGAGSRVEVDERKESPLDFALWKAARPGEPAWDSPWGRGRPGWHIECSAMSSAHLGETFDIHAGGRDLIFPHHENEIAQSRGAHGPATFARYWIHNGFINFAGEKMSKSLGNFFTIREVLELYSGEALRYFLLTVHYRHGLNFEIELPCPACAALLAEPEQDAGRCAACGRELSADELRRQLRFPGLEEADERVAYVYATLEAASRAAGGGSGRDTGRPADHEVAPAVAQLLAGFCEPLRQDFNTPAALGALSEPLREVNGLLAASRGVDPDLRRRTLRRFLADMAVVAEVLGCFGQDPAVYLAARRDARARRIGLDVVRVEALVAERLAARRARDFATADRVRAELLAMGVTVQDTSEGTAWSL
ncbi:MAG: cysteine--tRNA ligase [Candidatus Krumholzibacteriia bacterium]